VTEPEHAPAPHVTLHSGDSQPTVSEQSPLAHATVHDWVALHWMAPEHALVPLHSIEHDAALHVTPPEHVLLPQLTVQRSPPHTTPPEQVFGPHSMSQLAAFEQSTNPLHPVPVVPHCTRQSTPVGHTTPDAHLFAQSITQRPAASHVPFGHDCAEHGAPTRWLAPGEEPQAATSASRAVTCAARATLPRKMGVRRPEFMRSAYGRRTTRACAESHA
jgi:hypothetical protein